MAGPRGVDSVLMNRTAPCWIALIVLMLAPSAVGFEPPEPATPITVLQAPPVLEPALLEPVMTQAPIASGLLLPSTQSWLLGPRQSMRASPVGLLDMRADTQLGQPLAAAASPSSVAERLVPVATMMRVSDDRPVNADPFSPWAGEANRAQRLAELLAEAAMVQIEGGPLAQHRSRARSPLSFD